MQVESHSVNIVRKPWGYEYLVYQNSDVALWFLYLAHNQQTSFHAHPNKTTGLIVLNGDAEISFFDNKISVSSLEKVSIRKGFFHSTKSLSETGTCLFEIESPNNKLDLVRFKDSYGREGKPYEDSSFEYPKQNDCLSIDTLEEQDILFCDCRLQIAKIKSITDFDNYNDDINVMFLSGGIMTDYNVKVINPADIVKIKIIKELTQVFNIIDPDTFVIIFNKNE